MTPDLTAEIFRLWRYHRDWNEVAGRVGLSAEECRLRIEGACAAAVSECKRLRQKEKDRDRSAARRQKMRASGTYSDMTQAQLVHSLDDYGVSVEGDGCMCVVVVGNKRFYQASYPTRRQFLSAVLLERKAAILSQPIKPTPPAPPQKPTAKSEMAALPEPGTFAALSMDARRTVLSMAKMGCDANSVAKEAGYLRLGAEAIDRIYSEAMEQLGVRSGKEQKCLKT